MWISPYSMDKIGANAQRAKSTCHVQPKTSGRNLRLNMKQTKYWQHTEVQNRHGWIHLLGLPHWGSISITLLVVPELVSPWQVGVERADEIGMPPEQLLQVANQAVDSEAEIPHK